VKACGELVESIRVNFILERSEGPWLIAVIASFAPLASFALKFRVFRVFRGNHYTIYNPWLIKFFLCGLCGLCGKPLILSTNNPLFLGSYKYIFYFFQEFSCIEFVFIVSSTLSKLDRVPSMYGGEVWFLGNRGCGRGIQSIKKKSISIVPNKLGHVFLSLRVNHNPLALCLGKIDRDREKKRKKRERLVSDEKVPCSTAGVGPCGPGNGGNA
jgi:hypothetical protein